MSTSKEDIALYLGVNPRRRWSQSQFHVDDRRQRLVVDLNQLSGIRRRCSRIGDNYGDRFTDEADFARWQQRSWRGIVISAADRRMDRRDPAFDLGGREHHQRTAPASRSGIDFHNPGSRMGASNKCSIADAGNIYIV